MSKITVDSSLIKEALAQIEIQEHALSKLASVEHELNTVYQVIGLVRDGYIDVDDMHEKIAEFIQAPDALSIFKKAVELRSGGISLGRLVDNSSSLSKVASHDETPETRLHLNLFSIVN